MNLEFKQFQFGIIITCISKDGEIEDLDKIKSDIQDGIESVVDDVILERNNVVESELVDVVELTGGDSQ